MTLDNLSSVGLGTWQFSKGQGELGEFWPALPDADTTSIVKASLDAGVNWFDTAEKYGDGASEQALTSALKALDVSPDSVLIADKWWPKKRKASHLVESINQRLACLNGYPIGLYQIHWPESESWLWSEMKYLAKLVDEGKVRYVGLCNYNWRQVLRAYAYLKVKGVKLSSIQVRYNLAYRSIEQNNLLKVAQDLDLKIIAWSPLESGLLTGRFHQKPELVSTIKDGRRSMYGLDAKRLSRYEPLINTLSDIAESVNATPAQVALSWIGHKHKGRVLAIPGATTIAQAKSNAEAMSLALNPSQVEEIDALSLAANDLS